MDTIPAVERPPEKGQRLAHMVNAWNGAIEQTTYEAAYKLFTCANFPNMVVVTNAAAYYRILSE
jgi:hypothetical protein